jgi:hypothetical protein
VLTPLSNTPTADVMPLLKALPLAAASSAA